MFSDPFFWLSLAIAIILGYLTRHLLVSKQAGSAEEKIKLKLEEAQTQAKGVVLEAKDKAALLLEEVKKEEKEGKSQLLKFEDRLIKKEESLEKQFADIVSQKGFLEKGISDVGAKKLEIEELRKQILVELEKVARLSVEDAKKQVLDRIKEDHGIELAKALQKLEKERREEIEKKSLDIITSAIQRYSRS
ncbi:MAG: Rnase Y domain-containing protein, partial [Patescibacteria group bacterium]